METALKEGNLALAQVEQARIRLEGFAIHTINLQSSQFNKKSGGHCFFKAENLQRTGSISFRGMVNKVRVELEKREIKKLIVRGSEDVSLAAALTGQILKIPCTILLPGHTAPHIISAATDYGANIVLIEKGEAKAAEALKKLAVSRDDYLITEPEDDTYGAGEATAVLELLEDIPDLECLVLPATTPSLIRMVGHLLKDRETPIQFLVAEQNNETNRYRKPETLTGTVLASREQVFRSQFFLLQRMKTLVEQSACVCTAAILANTDIFRDQKVGIILHSGNVNLPALVDNMEGSASFFLQHNSEYIIECYHCRESFNVTESVLCNCLSPQRTFVCPRCMNCFCGAPKSYIEKFWEQAPQDVWDRISRERELHAVAPVNPLPYQAKHPLVLVVEPDRHIQHMARRIIEDLGYGVVVASDGTTGLQMAEAYQPDFVLTAALMPQMDGREMCRQIKESPKTKTIRVAVMTSLYTQQKYRSEAFKRFHVDEYVSKPLKMNDLQGLLRKYLDSVKEPA